MDLPEDIIVPVLLRLVGLGVSEPRVMVLEVEEMLHYLRLLNTASLRKYRVSCKSQEPQDLGVVPDLFTNNISDARNPART